MDIVYIRDVSLYILLKPVLRDHPLLEDNSQLSQLFINCVELTSFETTSLEQHSCLARGMVSQVGFH